MKVIKTKGKAPVRFVSSSYTATPKYGSVFSAVMRGSNQSGSSRIFGFVKKGSKPNEA